MSDILQEILANKRAEVERVKRERPLEMLQLMTGYGAPRRNFYGAVAAPRYRRPNLIAEVKRKSPSAGVIRPDFDPVAIARVYEQAGAQALSVLTDETYFDGRLEYIEQIKAAVGLPVLRKDFVVDSYQLYEARAFGADAVLLIGEALEWETLAEYVLLTRKLELCSLVEVHSRDTLLKVLQAVPGELRDGVLIGINNRDLTVQRTDLSTTKNVAEIVPPGMPIVSESGVKTRRDVEQLYCSGARALLIGETLMAAPDPGEKIRELFGESAV